MSKKEIIWRHILYETLQKGVKTFTQKEIAAHFGISTSTVFSALRAPRKLGAVEVTGRFFRLRDAERLLLLWATHRNLGKDIVYQTRVDASSRDIEGRMPPDVIFSAMSAFRFMYNEAPADYDQIYIYSNDIETIKKRFPKQKGTANLFVLAPDPYLPLFGTTTPSVQTFVDLWNIPAWYSKDFISALKKKLSID